LKFKTKLLTAFVAIFAVISFFSLRASAFDGEILVPKALKEGDTICVLSPCRTTSYRIKLFEERIFEITKDLEKRGFNVVTYEEAFTPSPLQLGDETEQLRADLFNKAVKDPDVDAIFAIWGGYGAMHILDKIDYEAFRENKKIFVGYSDITAISSAIFEKSGVVTFHGPMMGKEPNWKETLCFDNLFDMLMNPKQQTELCNIDDNTPFKAFKSGKCEAQVFG
jgi:muramoyltetrapeptide carboxypeptidase